MARRPGERARAESAPVATGSGASPLTSLPQHLFERVVDHLDAPSLGAVYRASRLGRKMAGAPHLLPPALVRTALAHPRGDIKLAAARTLAAAGPRVRALPPLFAVARRGVGRAAELATYGLIEAAAAAPGGVAADGAGEAHRMLFELAAWAPDAGARYAATRCLLAWRRLGPEAAVAALSGAATMARVPRTVVTTAGDMRALLGAAGADGERRAERLRLAAGADADALEDFGLCAPDASFRRLAAHWQLAAHHLRDPQAPGRAAIRAALAHLAEAAACLTVRRAAALALAQRLGEGALAVPLLRAAAMGAQDDTTPVSLAESTEAALCVLLRLADAHPAAAQAVADILRGAADAAVKRRLLCLARTETLSVGLVEIMVRVARDAPAADPDALGEYAMAALRRCAAEGNPLALPAPAQAARHAMLSLALHAGPPEVRVRALQCLSPAQGAALPAFSLPAALAAADPCAAESPALHALVLLRQGLRPQNAAASRAPLRALLERAASPAAVAVVLEGLHRRLVPVHKGLVAALAGRAGGAPHGALALDVRATRCLFGVAADTDRLPGVAAAACRALGRVAQGPLTASVAQFFADKMVSCENACLDADHADAYRVMVRAAVAGGAGPPAMRARAVSYLTEAAGRPGPARAAAAAALSRLAGPPRGPACGRAREAGRAVGTAAPWRWTGRR